MRRIFIFSVLLISAAGGLGCGPSLPPRMELPTIKITDAGSGGRELRSGVSYVFVDEFIDSRGSDAIVVMDGKEIPHIDRMGPVVAEGLKQALEQKGFEFSDTAPIVLSGEIRRWVANVASGFTSKVDSEASLYVEILDPANKRIYAGVYNGFASIESPSLDERDVKTALRTSLEEAIGQIAADSQLMKLLSAF